MSPDRPADRPADLPADRPDFTAVKTRQQAAWSSGDYAVIGVTLQLVGEQLAEACDLRYDEQVLDVAAGNGNATLAAARRGARVVSTDYVGALLERGAARARAEGLEIEFRQADVEALPFDDGRFDVVLSSFGVMFAPDHAQAAREMARVCRPGGRIGVASWTPDSLIGAMFKRLAAYVTPPAGVQPPALWGTDDHLRALFGPRLAALHTTRRDFVFRYRSPAHFVDVFRRWYGPVLKAFEAQTPERAQALQQDLEALLREHHQGPDGTLRVPSAYLEAVLTLR